MSTIILDCDLMRFPNSGLYHYCKNLGYHVNKQLTSSDFDPMTMYLPQEAGTEMEGKRYAIPEKAWHKLWRPFLLSCRVWHAPFQSGRMIPNRMLYKHINVVLTIHDLNALHEGKPEAEQRRSIAHVQHLIDQSDVVVCISEFTRNDVLRYCETEGKKICVIPNGLNALAVPALNASSYKPARPFLFGIGYVNAKKNYHVLVSLLKESDNLEVLVAGRLDDPDYVASIQQEVRAQGLEERFHLLGPVSEEEKSWYMHHCAGFVHPSLAEGFGLPVLEAMSVGKPVFISNLTSLPEIGGDAAFYFDSFEGSAMRDVVREGFARFEKENMEPKVRDRATQFSWERSAGRYIDIYRSLL